MLAAGRACGDLFVEVRQFQPFRHFIDGQMQYFDISDVQAQLGKMFDKVEPLAIRAREYGFSCALLKEIYFEDEDVAFLDRLARVGFRGFIDFEVFRDERPCERFRYRLKRGRLYHEKGCTAYLSCLNPMGQEPSEREREVEMQITNCITEIIHWESNNAKPNIALESFAEFLIKKAVEVLSGSRREKLRL